MPRRAEQGGIALANETIFEKKLQLGSLFLLTGGGDWWLVHRLRMIRIDAHSLLILGL